MTARRASASFAPCARAEERMGYGRALGEFLLASRYPFRHLSVFATAAELGLPLTVHVALGTDTLAQHPGMDGALVGEMSMARLPDGAGRRCAARRRSFSRRLVGDPPRGLPEGPVALAELGHDVRNFTTVDLDMIRTTVRTKTS